MKRLLIRAGFNPYHMSTIPYNIVHSFVGGNSGNLMFAYGVMNVLKTEDVEIDETYLSQWTDREAAEINARYDAFILPMADGFRPDFMEALCGITALIHRLTIPVVVIGVGLRSSYEPVFVHEFDNTVREFVKAVLDHSAIMGLRGQITAEYLKRLGFEEDRHYTAIGCPSLYMYGNTIKTQNIPNNISKIAFNYNLLAPEPVSNFISRSVNAIPERFMIQQRQRELMDIYIGKYRRRRYVPEKTVVDDDEYEKLKKEDKVRFFFNVPSWVDYLCDKDLFLGCRFHGTVAAVLADIPHVMLPFDARTRELAEYHDITRIEPQTIKANEDIFDYFGVLDFKSFERKQKENVEHYKSFLRQNSLEPAYNGDILPKGTSLLEKQTAPSMEIVHCIDSLNPLQKGKRVYSYYAAGIQRKLKGE